MIAIGFLTSLYLIQRDSRKAGIDPQVVSNMAFWCLLLGIAGTRLLHIIMFPETYAWNDPVGWIAIWRGGLVFQGAVPPVVLYCWFAVRKHHISFWKLADVAMPYVPLAHAFGRIGCFLNGCCYGRTTSVPWAIRFPRVPWDLSKPATGSPAFLDHCQQYGSLSINADHWSFPVHPTQLYGAAGLAATCLLLLYIRKRWHPVPGLTFPLYFIFYGSGRVFVEFFRGDHNPTILRVLTSQQVISFLFVIFGVLLLLVLLARRQPVRNEAA